MKKYMVGGAVRDSLLKLPIKEIDWVVVGATPKDLLAKGYRQVGKDFPVFLHPENGEEYALARIERKYGSGYKGFICFSSPEIKLEEDLRRRDLTINAIACDDQGNLIDPYHGQYDIQQRCLRHVSDAFREDPLRVLRVARFAARFAHLNFHIAPETLFLMKHMVSELPMLASERIWKETERALATNCPQIYFQVLRDCGALKVIFPEIDALFGIPTLNKWHSEIDSGMHTLMTLSIAAKLSNNIAVRFAALCHDVGKILTPKEMWPNHYDYGYAGVKIITKMCQRLKIPNSLRDLAKIVSQYHDLLHSAISLKPQTLIKLFNSINVWRRPEFLEQMILVSEADARGCFNSENNSYPQGEFLRKAFCITKLVTTKNIVEAGLNGAEIGKELTKQRQQALTNWKQNHNFIN